MKCSPCSSATASLSVSTTWRDRRPVVIAVGPFVYVRFHGPAKNSGRYSDDVLEQWGEWLAEAVRQGRSVYAYFNNDVGGHAPRDADRLRVAVTSG
jgi:uncharacterized protein YecE (DUF72 family)